MFPELKGKLNGHAIRVPMLNSSITDMVFNVDKPTTKARSPFFFATRALVFSVIHPRAFILYSQDAVNAMLKAAAASGPLAPGATHGPVMGFEERPLVSAAHDYRYYRAILRRSYGATRRYLLQIEIMRTLQIPGCCDAGEH